MRQMCVQVNSLLKKKAIEMDIVRDPFKMQEWSEARRNSGESIGFVPTMGALHRGHASLIERASSENDLSVVSIFVNPTQFGPGEDYASYPRSFEDDSELCRSIGVDAVFCPDADDMYLKTSSTSVIVTGLTSTMCGASRPGHFEGVATIVAKLFNCVKPHKAYFGQKDYQQFVVIQRMTEDLKFGVDIIMCDIVREDDGLALSSRNKYLDAGQRSVACYINTALVKGAHMVLDGEKNASKINDAVISVIRGKMPGCTVDYACVFDAFTLDPVEQVDSDIVIAVAVKVGPARLIDNVICRIRKKV